jgi:15-cis-phytoene desaturase
VQDLPGIFTTFDLIPGIPAPFNCGLVILINQQILTLGEKIQTVPLLLTVLIDSHPSIDVRHRLSGT